MYTRNQKLPFPSFAYLKMDPQVHKNGANHSKMQIQTSIFMKSVVKMLLGCPLSPLARGAFSWKEGGFYLVVQIEDPRWGSIFGGLNSRCVKKY